MQLDPRQFLAEVKVLYKLRPEVAAHILRVAVEAEKNARTPAGQTLILAAAAVVAFPGTDTPFLHGPGHFYEPNEAEQAFLHYLIAWLRRERLSNDDLVQVVRESVPMLPQVSHNMHARNSWQGRLLAALAVLVLGTSLDVDQILADADLSVKVWGWKDRDQRWGMLAVAATEEDALLIEHRLHTHREAMGAREAYTSGNTRPTRPPEFIITDPVC